MCDNCQYEDELQEIEDLLDDEQYEFANDTLLGIYDWVKEKKHITDKQKKAVDNIINAVMVHKNFD